MLRTQITLKLTHTCQHKQIRELIATFVRLEQPHASMINGRIIYDTRKRADVDVQSNQRDDDEIDRHKQATSWKSLGRFLNNDDFVR